MQQQGTALVEEVAADLNERVWRVRAKAFKEKEESKFVLKRNDVTHINVIDIALYRINRHKYIQ